MKADIHTVSMEDLDRLGLDNAGNLYWDGKPVTTKHKVTLEWWTNGAIILGGISTFGLLLIQVLSQF